MSRIVPAVDPPNSCQEKLKQLPLDRTDNREHSNSSASECDLSSKFDFVRGCQLARLSERLHDSCPSHDRDAERGQPNYRPVALASISHASDYIPDDCGTGAERRWGKPTGFF